MAHLKVERTWINGDDPFWPAPGELHTRGEAWIDLVSLADPQARFPASLRELAERWAWSRTKVRIFLGKLTEMERIKPTGAKHPGRGGAVIYQIQRPKRRAAVAADDPELWAEYERLHAVWKDRPGDPKVAGFHNYRKLRRAGVSFEKLKSAARAYWNFCRAWGTLGTEKQLMSRTFFGPNELWAADYSGRPMKQARREVEEFNG